MTVLLVGRSQGPFVPESNRHSSRKDGGNSSLHPVLENPENPVRNMVTFPHDGEGHGERLQHAQILDEASSEVSLGMENLDGPPAEEDAPRTPSPSATNSEISF